MRQLLSMTMTGVTAKTGGDDGRFQVESSLADVGLPG